MRNKYNSEFGSTLEAIAYPFLLLALLWSVFLLEKFYPAEFIQLGILPKQVEGLKGILLSPLIHAPRDISHIINNSFPAAVLTGALFYFYRKIAFRVFVLSWIISGALVWLAASDEGHFHIGFSGVIYALAGFLFTSGTIRKYRPLQGIALFVVFIYGSMIWGIFPLKEGISWEGHLFGLLTGVFLAFLYRKKGPQAPRFQYEIEKELGIEPPDLEGIWKENIRLAEERERMEREAREALEREIRIVYHYQQENKQEKRDGEERGN